jgi:hypothetical protein
VLVDRADRAYAGSRLAVPLSPEYRWIPVVGEADMRNCCLGTCRLNSSAWGIGQHAHEPLSHATDGKRETPAHVAISVRSTMHRTVPSPTLFRRTVGLLAIRLRRTRVSLPSMIQVATCWAMLSYIRLVVCQSCRNGKLIVLCRLMHPVLSRKHDSCSLVPLLI